MKMMKIMIMKMMKIMIMKMMKIMIMMDVYYYVNDDEDEDGVFYGVVMRILKWSWLR